MSQQIIGWDGHFVFPIHLKNTNLVEGVEILLPIKFRWITFSGFRGEVENVSANQRPGRTFCFFPIGLKTQTWWKALIACFLSSFVEFCSAVSSEKSKMSQPIRSQGGHFVFPIGPKNTNLVSEEKSKMSQPIRGQRGRPSCVSDRPEKYKLGRGRLDLASCQVSLNSIQRFQRRSRKCLSQSEARRPSCFSDRPEKHKLGRRRWDLASCQVSLNSVQRFLQRSRKCLSQSEAGAAILLFLSARKTQTW